MSRIVPFYLGEIPDDYGRNIEDLWAFDHADLEEVHDYVQRLFPSRQPSQFEEAPLLDEDTIRAFHDNSELRWRLLVSLDLMLRFYGLRREGGEVVEADDFAARAANWLTPFNHNFLRITRILLCLRALGLPEWGRAFFRRLEAIYQRHRTTIGERSFRFWQAAGQ
jgi:Opioid growth factor receptor (OGFr) conserved region